MILAFITYSMVVKVCQGARPSFYHQVGDTLYKNAYNGNGTLAALRGKIGSSFVFQFQSAETYLEPSSLFAYLLSTIKS